MIMSETETSQQPKNEDIENNIKSEPDDDNVYINNEIELWDDLELDPNLLRGIFAYGFEKPSPIQKKAIRPVIDGKDMIAQAQSGTGKTATFSVGALQSINLSENTTQVLILSPTRELSMQTSSVITNLGSFMKGLNVATLFGGTNIEDEKNNLKKNKPHIICGCPGRVYDMIRRNNMQCKNIKLLILDEADEMLSFGFKEQVYNIFQQLNSDVQVCLFSATLPESISSIINKIMRNPVRISVKREQLTLEGIKQFYIAMENDEQKYETLKHLFSYITFSQSIIYCNSVNRVQQLYTAMLEEGFPVCCIHSNMSKSEREKSFNDFRTGSSRVLISSNVTARGIDIQQVSIVINFDIPKCVHTYLHRIGRSGRWGRKGVGINFVTRRDINNMKKIEQHYSTQIEEMPADLDFLKCN